MTELSNVLNVLQDAGQYFQEYSGSTFVIYIDGASLYLEDDSLSCIADDIALLRTLNIKVVLVFSPELADSPIAIESTEMVEKILGELHRTKMFLERALNQAFYRYRIPNTMIFGSFISARPYGIINGVNYGYYGRVRSIDSNMIRCAVDDSSIVVILPYGIAPSGEFFIIDGCEITEQLSSKLKAEKVIMLSQFTSDFGHELNVYGAKAILDENSLSCHDKKLLETAIKSVEDGVERAHLLDAKLNGAVVLELLTRDGIGTMITNEAYDLIREGTVRDIPQLMELMAPLESSGVLIKRSTRYLEKNIKDFYLMFRDGALIGSVGFHHYPEENMAELAGLIIHPEYRKGKKANILLKYIEQKAISEGCDKIFLLTTQTAHWFIENGFEIADISNLPKKKQENYDYSRNSQVLIKKLQ